MITKLVNCGCSFAHGYNGDILKDYIPVKQKGLADLKEHGWKSIGWYLSQEKNFEYVDISRNGNSNEAILRTLRTYLHHNDNDIFVVIGWTHAFRREYINWNTNKNQGEFIQYREIPKSGSIFSKMAEKFYGGRIGPTMVEFNERKNRPLAFSDHIEYRKYSLILQTQQMLELLKIPYLMYNGCGNEHDSNYDEVLDLKQQIDKNNFFQFDGPSLDEYVLKNRDCLSKDGGHPNAKGHSTWADLLLPKFKELTNQ